MNSQKKVIFDLDGTLYSFKGSANKTFTSSLFYTDLRIKIADYITLRLGVGKDEAWQSIQDIDKKYIGELSTGFEKDFGIDRYEYYAQTWGGMDAERYVEPNQKLRESMEVFAGNALLLTAAPRVWADKVLQMLDLRDVFGESIITGEPDIRKPSEKVFETAKNILGVDYADITSVGDQNFSDIVPAKKLGMKTIIISNVLESADQRADTIGGALRLLKGEINEA